MSLILDSSPLPGRILGSHSSSTIHQPRPPGIHGMASALHFQTHTAAPLAAGSSYRDDVDSEFQPRNTSLETRSRSPSPNPTPTPGPVYEYYGTANLTDRSRSPSPSSTVQTEGASRKSASTRQPVTVPKKPSALNLSPFYAGANMPRVLPSPTVPQPHHKSPGSINFPKLSVSPSHGPYDWDEMPRGAFAPVIHRPASSEHLYRAYEGHLSRPVSRERPQHPPHQPMQPVGHQNYDIPRQMMAYENWMHSHKGADLPIRLSNDGYGRTVDNAGSSTLPRSYRYDQPLLTGKWNYGVGMVPINQLPTKQRRHSDSEDDDWC